MDPRQQRTWQQLKAAIVTLASERPASTLTVSAVARAAGVTRDTFYRYASSPTSLLAAVLTEELHALPAPEHGGTKSFIAAEHALLDHIVEHANVYRQALVHDSDGRIRDVLTRRIAAVLGRYADDHPEILPSQLTESSLPDAQALGVAYAASGTVGAIEVWLRGDRLDDIDAASRAIVAASPQWWMQELGREEP